MRSDLVPVLFIAAGAVYFAVDYVLHKTRGRHLVSPRPAKPVSFYHIVFMILLLIAVNALLLLGFTTVDIVHALWGVLVAYAIGRWVGQREAREDKSTETTDADSAPVRH